MNYEKHLRDYQIEIAKSDKMGIAAGARTGKTRTALAKAKYHYPNKLPLIITTNTLVKTNLHPKADSGWFVEGKLFYEDLEMIPINVSFKNKYKNNPLFVKELLKGKSIIGNNHYITIELIIELHDNGYINLDDYVLIIDEVHYFKNPGEVKFTKKGLQIKGKAGYYIRELNDKCHGKPIMLSATPATVGYVDYANYLIMYGEYPNFNIFKDKHINMKSNIINGRKVQAIDHSNYKNVNFLKAKIMNNFNIIGRKDPILLEGMGEEIPKSNVFFENSPLINKVKSKNVFIERDGTEVEIIDGENVYNLLKKSSYDIFNPNNDKCNFIMERLDTDQRLVVFYSLTDDLITLLEALKNKNENEKRTGQDYIEHFVVRGATKVEGLSYNVYDKHEFKKHKHAILFVQYKAGCEGLTLHDVVSTNIHYSLPNKYDFYKQASARTDGPLEGRYGFSNVITLMSDYEYPIFESLQQKKDFDATEYNYI